MLFENITDFTEIIFKRKCGAENRKINLSAINFIVRKNKKPHTKGSMRFTIISFKIYHHFSGNVISSTELTTRSGLKA